VAPKVLSTYHTKVSQKISALKIESFRYVATILKIMANILISKMKLLDSIVYVISQVIFFGVREIAQGGGEIMPKVSPKVSKKIWVIFGTSNFTITATLMDDCANQQQSSTND